MIVWLWSACGREDDATRFARGLESGDCAPIRSVENRDTCWTANGRCDEVSEIKSRAECAFRSAETHDDPAMCAEAGEWADDCRMHLWSAGFHDWAPRGVSLAEAEPVVAAHVQTSGFTAADERPWSAWYRWALGRMRPLDRDQCRALPELAHQTACLQTGLVLYGDLLNMARDQHLYPCDGGPLPTVLQTAPDAEIDALRAARTDLCP